MVRSSPQRHVSNHEACRATSFETPTALDAMWLELVGRVVDSERDLKRLRIPPAFWPFIAASWNNDNLSLYGSLDLSFQGKDPAQLLSV